MKKLLFVFLLSACSSQIDQQPTAKGDGTTNEPNASADAQVQPRTTHDASTPATDAGSADAETDAGEPEEPPAQPSIRFVGRSNNNVFSWSGSRIIARFNGTGVRATLSENSNSHGSQWDVSVDNKLDPSPLILSPGTATYSLSAGLSSGEHTVELWKRTEASVGSTTFVGFDFDGELLAPPATPKRRMEFLSDSASNGYGIEGTNPTCLFEPSTENEHKAYPALLSSMFDSDNHDLGASGKGIVHNYSRTDDEVFSILYRRSSPFTSVSTWDASLFQVDVAFIVLGGNDYSLTTDGEAPPNREEFEAKYLELVRLVRSKQPRAHIFCGIAPSLKDSYPQGYGSYSNMKLTVDNVSAVMAREGDHKVYPFEFSRSTSADLTGCGFHPNAAKHQSMALEAAAAIREKTGWK